MELSLALRNFKSFFFPYACMLRGQFHPHGVSGRAVMGLAPTRFGGQICKLQDKLWGPGSEWSYIKVTSDKLVTPLWPVVVKERTIPRSRDAAGLQKAIRLAVDRNNHN